MRLVDNPDMSRLHAICKGFVLTAATLLFFTNSIGYLEPIGDVKEPLVSQFYHFDFDNVKKGPWLNARAVLLVNYENGEVLHARNAEQVKSIASISKLVTAMVVLDNGVDLNRTEKITRDDARRSSRSRLRVGSELTLRDLLYASLASSDNRAARVLARAVSGSIEQFAAEMNAKVADLGLTQTVFYEPTGLDERNVSTAHEVAKLLHYAYKYELIAEFTAEKQHRARYHNKKNYARLLPNTNRLLWSRYDVLAGKTGYIQAADYCLTSLVRNKKGERLTLVLLGVPGDRLRFKEARRLLDWGYRHVG